MPAIPRATAAATAGSTFTFGRNAETQLGHAEGSGPAAVAGVGISRFTRVEGGGAHSLAIDEAGDVWAWGSNSLGQAARPLAPLTPNRPPAKVAGISGVIDVAAGNEHSLALTDAGSVFAWGSNAMAQLSLRADNVGYSATPVPVDIVLPEGETIVDVEAGANHSMALTSLGRVFVWGSNSHGQMGTAGMLLNAGGDAVASAPLISSPTEAFIGEGPFIVDIAAGNQHSVAVSEAGEVWTWGRNDVGQLGHGEAVDRRSIPARVRTSADAVLGGVADATAGRAHSVARLHDGTLYAWGNATPATMATPVAGIAGVTSVVAGGDHDLAIVELSPSHAEVWSWGLNTENQLGRSGAPGTPAVVGTWTSTVAIGAGTSHSLVAVAPEINAAPTELAFPGTIEVGDSAAPMTFSVTNNGPGDTRVTSVSSNSPDFVITNTGESGSCLTSDATPVTLADGGSCSVEVTFIPTSPGSKNGSVTVEHEAFGEPLSASLSGSASVVQGSIRITALDDTAPASPAAMPLSDIPTQPGSPKVQDLEAAGLLDIGDLRSIGLLDIGDLRSIGLLDIGDLRSIGLLDIGDLSGVGLLDIGDLRTSDRLPIGDLRSIGLLDIGDLSTIDRLLIGDLRLSSPAARELYQQVAISQITLREPYRWDDPHDADTAHAHPFDAVDGGAILAQSSDLHGRPLHTVSLYDVATDEDAWAALQQVATGHVEFDGPPLSGLSVLGFLLGSTALDDLGTDYDWCTQLDDAGYSPCGSGLGRADDLTRGPSSSALELQMAGVPVNALNLTVVELGDIPAGAPVQDLILSEIPLYHSNLGSLPADDLAPAGCDCTLWEALANGDLDPGAQLRDIWSRTEVQSMTLGELVYGLYPPSSLGFDDFTLHELGVGLYRGYDTAEPPLSNTVSYRVEFDNDALTPLPDGVSVSVTLPDTFLYERGSATMHAGGAPIGVEGSDESVDRATNTVTWPVDVPVLGGQTLTIDFEARPGLELGLFAVERVEAKGVGTAVAAEGALAPVRVVDAENAYGPNDQEPGATPIIPFHAGTPHLAEGANIRIGHISTRGDTDLYRISGADVSAGDEIVISLNHQLAGDADIMLFGAPGMTGEAPLRTPEDRTPLTLTNDLLLDPDSSDVAVAPDVVVSERALLEGRPLLGVSGNRGANGERIRALALEGAGDYIIAVVGYNGASANTPYSLRVHITSPVKLPNTDPRGLPGTPVDSATSPTVGTAGDPVLLGDPTTAETLFLAAPSRLADDASADMFDALEDVELPGIIGNYSVLAVERDAGVAAAYADWDANPLDPTKANDVVREINRLVDSMRSSSLKYLVVLGGDEVIPMARVVDLTSKVNQRPFVHHLALLTDINEPGNSVLAAAAHNRVLTDDGLADFAPTPIVGFHYLHVPDVAIGRLVETEGEIVTLLEQFVRFDGTLEPATTAVTSSVDFLDDLAEEMASVMNADTTIIGEGDWSSTDGVDTLAAALANHDVVAFNGHSDPVGTETRGGGDTYFDTSSLLAPGSIRDGAVLISAGCNAGLPIADSLVRTGIPDEWSQSALAAGASSLSLNSGYGVGAKSTLAYTEELLVRYAGELGGFDQGYAMVEAKSSYVRNVSYLDEVDIKILQQMTQFGMPHLRYEGSVDPAPEPSLVGSVSSLTTVPVRVQTTNPGGSGYVELQKHDTDDGSYFSADGNVMTAPYMPVQPAANIKVGPDGSTVVGFMFDSATSFEAETPGLAPLFDPVLTVPELTGGVATSNEPRVQSVSYPANSAHSAGNHLRLALGLFRSADTPGGPTLGSQTIFTQVNGRAFAAPGHAGPAPTITEFDSLVVGETVTFLATVTSQTPLAEVSVLYREVSPNFGGGASGDWHYLELKPNGPDRFTRSTTVSPGMVAEAIVQARTVTGATTQLTNKADLIPGNLLPPGQSENIAASVRGDAAPSNNPDQLADGWWVAPEVILERLNGFSGEILYRIDYGAEHLETGPISLAGLPDGWHVVSWTTANRAEEGAIAVRIDTVAPEINVISPNGGAGSTAEWECIDATSEIEECSGILFPPNNAPSYEITSGSPLPRSEPGTYRLQITAVDEAGHKHTETVTYHNGYEFEGFLEPVTYTYSGDEDRAEFANGANAGRDIPMKWRLTTPDGQQVNDLSVVRGIGSERCADGGPSTPPPPDTTGNDTPGLSHTGSHYRYGWSTQRSWAGTCRTFVLLLDDGSLHLADFLFR